MPKKKKTEVDIFLERETDKVRKALESASRYFDDNDDFTVNTLEAIYAQESSFGTNLGKKGIGGATGHFKLQKDTALRYGLVVDNETDQRFDIRYAASAAARYLKDLDNMFSRDTVLMKNIVTSPIKNKTERKKIVLAAYNGGEGRIAGAQAYAQIAGKDFTCWDDVKSFLGVAGAEPSKIKEIIGYIPSVLMKEVEFVIKSLADKKKKKKEKKAPTPRCSVGHWVTIKGNPVFICD